MEISFEQDVRAWSRYMSDKVARQIPFVTAMALSDTVRDDLKPAAERLIVRKLDRPTPFTQRAMLYERANKTTLRASVYAKPIQGKYLKLQNEGGTRYPAMRAVLVPVGIRLNQYGNMRKGAVKAALARPNTFTARFNGVSGIWQRSGRKRGQLKLLVRFMDATQYKPRLGFHPEMARIARSAFPGRFNAAFERAMRTAR